MKIQTPPGMRDFYPDDMRLQNWLFGHWQEVARRFGFEEYEGPIFEFLELYTAKSGDEIVSQLFNFEDRGARRFAIRPEMTPTLASMVAARANALGRPIKWFSLPRMCRAERPQRGRLREFFQWNVDILGVDDVLADAEVMAVAVTLLKALGLTAEEVVLQYSSRTLAAAVLAALGVPADRIPAAFALIDRLDKLAPAEVRKQWAADVGRDADVERVLATFEQSDPGDLAALLGAAAGAALDELRELQRHLSGFGVAEYCAFDLRIVRGLAYYTGPVCEVRTRGVTLRALFGGGRYDNLTELLGGPRVTGVGFGAGDVPLIECLREFGRLPTLAAALDVFVIDARAELFPKALDIVGRLRSAQLTVDFSYKRQNVGKQFKQAAGRNARYAVVVGDEFASDEALTVKDLKHGRQQTIPAARLLNDPHAALAGLASC